jgi:20S proteasome alpha/beta subunit
MTLIIGARCTDGVVLAADRRRLSRYERGPETNKLFKLSCGVALAGAGDDAVLNEARLFIDRRIRDFQSESAAITLYDVVEITASVVNELVGYYKERVEEPFGYVLAGLDGLNSGDAELYTVFGAGFSDVPWACLGSGSSYARPLIELLLADGSLSTEEATRVIAPLFTLVSNVQHTILL